jgi:DNA (cytosine-5)-methyltransferase 1
MAGTLTAERITRADTDLELLIDSFAGGGGASTGIEAALGRPVDYAINHDKAAITMHRANHPRTVHLQEDVWSVEPRDVVGRGRIGLAWFSPDCTHHSRAKGGKPRSNRARGLAWVAVKWAKLPERQRPVHIGLENVSEFEDWGPLDKSGWPISSKRGVTFRRFVGCLRSRGYTVDWRVLDAAQYGAPTHRRRLFLWATLNGRVNWPEPTHGWSERDLFGSRLKPFRTAAQCLDWSLPLDGLVRSRRIRQYIDAQNRCHTGYWIMSYYGNLCARSVDLPLPTITTHDRFALVSPLGEMRMLTPRELARCQGFPESYILTGTKTSQVARLGNSVCPPVVEAVVRANFTEVA